MNMRLHASLARVWMELGMNLQPQTQYQQKNTLYVAKHARNLFMLNSY